MKKIIFGIMIVISFFVTGCSNDEILKTQYSIGEQAKLDDIEITMEKASYKTDTQLFEVVFSVTNHRDNTITLVPDQNFVLYDINKVQMMNTYVNNNNIVKKDQTIHYTLQYSVSKKEMYEILFYSGIVENNIKFVVTNVNVE